MPLEDELSAAAGIARTYAEAGEELAGIVAGEPAEGVRVYLCAYRRPSGERLSWLALDNAGRPVADRALVRDVVSIVGMCELAEESAGGGALDELRARLAELRRVERPPGIEEADAAAAELVGAILAPPRVASLAYLELVGGAATKLERALGEIGASPFAAAMVSGRGAVDELARDVELNYKGVLA